jgi:hypothetical protein
MLFRSFRAFCGSRDASVMVTSAIFMPVLIGFIALAGEFGHGLVTKGDNQRVADLAAFAGALAYSANGSSTTAMSAAAKNVGVLNGVAASAVTASLVTSPRVSADSAVSAVVSTTNVLLLAPVLRSGSSLPVSAKSFAQMAPTASSCMLALSASGTGVVLSGGTSLSAPNCTIASNSTIAVPCGTTITAKAVTYNTAAPSQPCSGITGTITKAATTDPLSANAAVIAAAAHASSLSSLTSPSAPTVSSVPSGTNVSFAYSGTPALPSGCSAALSGSAWTMTCTSGGTYKFGTVSLGGGQSLTIVTSGSSATSYNFSGAFSLSGTINVNISTSATITYNFGQGVALSSGTMSFGAGTFNFAQSGSISQSIANNGGGTMSFGAGTFNLAQGISNSGTSLAFGAGTFKIGGGTTNSCNSAYYSICNSSGTLTFGGPSTFVFSSGIYNAGGSTLTLGSGTTNSFNIGSTGSGGNFLAVGGSSTTTFADATGTGNLFQMVGNFTSGGGSCVILSAATAHDINGSISTMGATVLGAGVYSIYGYIALGAGGGGDVSCNGSTVGFSGTNVTIAIAGTSTSTISPCSGAAFCIGAGYSNVSLSAPTTGTNAYLAIIGPLSASNTSSAFLTEGASNTTVAGAFYFPNGPLTMSGGASIGNQTGQCLQIVAAQITLSGGTSATAANCFAASSASSAVKLVQ